MYITLEPMEFPDDVERLALLASELVAGVAGLEPDEAGALDGNAEIYGADERIVRIALDLVDLAADCDEVPRRERSRCVKLLRRAADSLAAPRG